MCQIKNTMVNLMTKTSVQMLLVEKNERKLAYLGVTYEKN